MTIELIPEDEPNPDSLQNTPFTNVVLPRRRNKDPPSRVCLAENPWDVALMDPKSVPWHVRFPPRLDIPRECWYYDGFDTGAFMSTPFTAQLLEQAVKVVSASYNGVMGKVIVVAGASSRGKKEGPYKYEKESVREKGVLIPTPALTPRKKRGNKAKTVVKQEVMDAETSGFQRDLKSKRQNSVVWDVLELDSTKGI
ncbi:hypothetical protein PQX77_008723 [Marasmius sp. AFHP31]|nr:hypothetical protein PQX77_008723 [Marasmius sp. AFHP31]